MSLFNNYDEYEDLMEGVSSKEKHVKTSNVLAKAIKKIGGWDELLKYGKRKSKGAYDHVFNSLLENSGDIEDMDDLLDYFDSEVPEGRVLGFLMGFAMGLDIRGLDFWRGVNIGGLLNVSSSGDKVHLLNGIIAMMMKK